jgi:hypothetical protein
MGPGESGYPRLVAVLCFLLETVLSTRLPLVVFERHVIHYSPDNFLDGLVSQTTPRPEYHRHHYSKPGKHVRLLYQVGVSTFKSRVGAGRRWPI